MFTSDVQPGWSMDSNPICHPSPAKKMKCSFLAFVQLLMISWAGQWTQTPSATPLLTKKWNPHSLLRSTSDVRQTGQWTQTPSTTPLQPKKMKCLFLDYVHFWWSAWLIDELEPHLPPLSTKKMKCSIFDYVQLLMISQAGQLTQSPSASPLQPIKWNASFWIMFTSDDQPGWLMDSNLICHPSPANKMKCSLLDYVHFGCSARLVDGLKPHPSPVSSQ